MRPQLMNSKLIFVPLLLLMLSVNTWAEELKSPAYDLESTAPLPESQFLLQNRFEKISETIDELEDRRELFQSAETLIVDMLIKTEVTEDFKIQVTSSYKTLKSKLAEMSAENYWEDSTEKLFFTKYLKDVELLEEETQKIMELSGAVSGRDMGRFIEQQTQRVTDSVVQNFYFSLGRALSTETVEMSDKFRDIAFTLYIRNVLEPERGFEYPLEGKELEAWQVFADRAKNTVSKMNSDLADEPTPRINEYSKHQIAVEHISNAIATVEDAISAEKNNLKAIAVKLENVRKQSESTFSSTNYMMLLLAFSFGLTVLLRGLFRDFPVITDQTLVEYGGMSFLILAVIILASGGKISSDTVGPLLGTIAGYIFGRSVATRPNASASPIPNQGNLDQPPLPKAPAPPITTPTTTPPAAPAAAP